MSKMKQHIVTIDELDQFVVDKFVTFAGSHSADGKSNKKFEISVNGLCKVTNHGVAVYVGMDKLIAISMYNNCP